MRLNDLLSDRNFTLNMAASNKDEKVKFSILKERSLLSKGGKISDKGIDVKSIRLDSINFKGLEKNVSGLKIDTEGEDFKVLIGAENLIKKSSPNLIVEVRKDNFNEIKNFLSVLGYNHFYENELDLVHFERFGIMDLFASKF